MGTMPHIDYDDVIEDCPAFSFSLFNREFTFSRADLGMDDDDIDIDDIDLRNLIDDEEEALMNFEAPSLEKHRCKLKLGDVPYRVAYQKGFFSNRGKNPYKRDSRLYLAFKKGRRDRLG